MDALEAVIPGVSAGVLQVGQVLKLPSSGSGTTKYTIVQGDTLWSIAQKADISLDALLAANLGVYATNLQIGQVINVPNASQNGGCTATPTGGDEYVMYSGPASAFPDASQRASYDTLWLQDAQLMKFHDSDDEISLIQSLIGTVSAESGVDARVILCTIVQESGGNIRILTTSNGIINPGLMQSHKGVSFNPADPAGSILQMIRDGTEGTKDCDGLRKLHSRYGNYYVALRGYNSGSGNAYDLNDPVGATASYVRDIANRLMAHTWNGM